MAECVKDSDKEDRISYGDYVVLKRGDIFKSVQIENKKKVIFEKQWFFLDNAVGQLYGAVFEIEAGGSLKIKAAKHSGDSLDSKEAGQDNRHIVDDGRSQKLSRDDIETLKEQGLKGQEIVQQLIDNSTTFKDKTEFAQEKYIKKKKKKYESNITILKPSTRLLAMMYHGREPGKICHLRYDTLAQILTLGNIHAGSKILVFETCAGLVLGSVMERMGGYGSVIQMYPGGGPTRAGMESFGFPSHFHETLHEFPLCKVNALLAGTLDLSEKDAEGNGRSESSQETSGVSEEKSSEPQSMEVSVDPQEEMRRVERERLREQRAQEKKLKMEEKRKKLSSAAALLEGRNADGLVIASRFHPCPVLMGLLKFLAPSRPFVVYCQYREPLIECYTKLREQGGAISLRLTDSWLRHYQVLPNRTHPVLLMSGGGGYLLSGTTVAADAAKARNQHKAEEPVAKRLKLDKISSSCDSSA
ncbi:tRNA (adenine(58)-N(1))-methyltransferase non-catalytic subunit TRM6 [Carassius gibelio]|uniref:tRNA (adenine(58)-N(1))-methyltransferase non-catalytic subunit TRM6 n=1 Tax=Carassius gibelio TaxID=101364 RepID=UPI002277852C|nr:tRNA (adenine(58)-N(1))-methyltransferase non-catalytic subunit TRM6 [Carassius gibelio]XP_052443084.1 tRNA (adenine(58)-N(1))-methyltransferase non-catalytic subunit TRM6 [Carassius gibelio]